MDSGLRDDLVFGDPNAPRFVLWNGKLRPVPSKPTDLPIFDLMSIGGKLRAGFGAIGIRPPPPVCPLDCLFPQFTLCFYAQENDHLFRFYLMFNFDKCSGSRGVG